MKVYSRAHANHTLFVTPGEREEGAQWRDENGVPKQFKVVFHDGVAEVDKTLGDWLIEKGHAGRARIIRAAQQLLRA